MKDYFKKIPTLYTRRLTLRKIGINDVDDMYEYSRDEQVSRYLLWSTHPDRAHTKRYIKALEKYYAKGMFYDWGIEETESGRLIGTCGFARIDGENRTAELGYVLRADRWGMGYAAEAAREVLRVGFCELGLHRIEARYMVDNAPSARVMEKLGMRFEGIKRAELFVKGKYRDIGYYSILKDEYIGK